jgi:hypothetical protein
MIALLWVMAAAAAWAQAAPPSQRIVPDVKAAVAKAGPAQMKTAQAPAKPAASPMKAKPVAARASKPMGSRPANAVVKKAALRVPAGKPVAKRDPFVSPIREQGPMTPGCSTGKKCLAIGAIVLRGVVSSQAGMIAVVEGTSRRISYFLRENDPVFNGYVVKITPDSVVFRENVMDRLGKQSTRDVVMKVVAPAV